MFTPKTAGPSKPLTSFHHSTTTAQQITVFRSRAPFTNRSGEASTTFHAQPSLVGCDSRKDTARLIAFSLASRFEILIYSAISVFVNGRYRSLSAIRLSITCCPTCKNAFAVLSVPNAMPAHVAGMGLKGPPPPSCISIRWRMYSSGWQRASSIARAINGRSSGG